MVINWLNLVETGFFCFSLKHLNDELIEQP
jgi:hypothetical protein